MNIIKGALKFVAREAASQIAQQIGEHVGDAIGTLVGRRIDPNHRKTPEEKAADKPEEKVDVDPTTP